jgi:hypothetical protein
MGIRTVSERANESLTLPEEALNSSFVQQSAVNTEAPATSKQQSFWFWNRMRATTTETITEATTAQVTTEAAPTTTNTTEEPSVEHTTFPNMFAVRDTDHNCGTFNVSVINPFSQEVNGSLYKYLLIKILDGLHSKWKL